MVENIHGKIETNQSTRYLFSSLPPSKEDIELVKAICYGGEKIGISKLYETDFAHLTIQDRIAELKNALCSTQLNQLKIQNELTKLANKIQQIDMKNSINEKSHGLHTLLDQEKLNTLIKLHQVLRLSNILFMPARRVRNFFRSRLGNLYQHPPLPFCANPKRYTRPILLDNPPTISIVTPSYNQGEFLERTLLSVLNQRYPKLEYILQDGGSQDDTKAIIDRYKKAFKHVESQKDKGQSNALNLGFQHATGEIMAYLNSDDILLGGSLHYIAKYFNDHPEVDVVYGHRVIINEDDHKLGRWILPPHDDEVLTWADYIPQETLFWRRSIWEKSGGFIDEQFRFAMDWDLLLRFKEAGAKFKRLPRFLGAFRVHSQQKTSANLNDIGKTEMRRLRERCHGRRLTSFEIRRGLRRYHMRHLILDKLYKLGVLRY